MNRERLQTILADEPRLPSKDELDKLEALHRRLLWEDVPRELMPHFRPVDKDLEETDESVGEYTFQQKMSTRNGMVYEAVDSKKDRKVVVKVTEKCDVVTPGEVEAINRELRFLTGFIRHPNIIPAVDFLHGPRRVYLVTDHGGNHNLSQWLSELPGSCMNADDALKCFSQVSAALTYCHGKDISHRSVSLEHITIKRNDDGVLVTKLLDFRSAMVVKAGASSIALCGTLPSIAPEVLRTEPYLPMSCDCWSAGVVLLEMVGGKGSLFAAVQMDVADARTPSSAEERYAIAQKIQRYFQTPGNHQIALACMNSAENAIVLDILTRLLQPERKRANLHEVPTLEVSQTTAAERDLVVQDYRSE